MKTVEYKGVTATTVYDYDMSDEQYEQLVKDYYTRPNLELVKQQMKKIHNGGVQNNHVTNYYVKDLMAKTKIYYNKWSIEEVLEYKPLTEVMFARTQHNKNVYPDDMSDIKKLETAFRLGGKGFASKPANFPMKTADYILSKYNVNDNYYDFSCGWGVRLTSALKNGLNYYGTDPNYILCDRLNDLADTYKSVNNVNNVVDIRPLGSEVYQQDWVGKMGLAFTSPPYFYLEDYRVGEQSYKDGTSYEDWLGNYLAPTIDNIYGYLVDDGYMIININNFDKFNLIQDTIDLAAQHGFYLDCVEKLSNIKRVKSTKGFNDNSEQILVFKKAI